MSHFTTLKTKITDREALVKALADVGFREVEVHDSPKHLRGFMGEIRLTKAEVIIRRKHLGLGSNDLGFQRQKDGTFNAIISSFDRVRFSQQWVQQVTQRYAYHVAKVKLAEQGFSLIEEDLREDGRVHLVLRRMG
jgi:hypothetical protein